ncbi:MAG: EamA family transporter [Candidatus Hodarchaeales archaeon]
MVDVIFKRQNFICTIYHRIHPRPKWTWLSPYGSVSFFLSIDLIEASLATPISSINPLIAVIIGILVLKEKLNPIQAMGILLIVLGSITISIS